VLVLLDLSHDNISYSIVFSWLYILVNFVSNFSWFPLCAGLFYLGIIWDCLLVVGIYYTSVVPIVPICINPEFFDTIVSNILYFVS
jgi:hypothetical protein